MIYCVWYPSGGFGHFINALLTLHGDNFVRPTRTLSFSANGDSHNLDLVVPKYFMNQWTHKFEFDTNKNYSVLIDNGIWDENNNFKNTFPTATVIKICYSKWSWPIVARAMINKAMKSNIETELPITEWEVDEPWARREKYFLFLRDWPLKQAWQQESDCANFFSICLEDQLDYSNFFYKLNCIVAIAEFKDTWKQWRVANAMYIDPFETAHEIVMHVLDHRSVDISHIKDIWTQAVVYYFIWEKFGVEVPHNDFADFFTNTSQIIKLLS